MSKLFLTTMTALALVGVAAAALPSASALFCASVGGEPFQTAAETCNFAVHEAGDVVRFGLEETNDVVAFALDHLP